MSKKRGQAEKSILTCGGLAVVLVLAAIIGITVLSVGYIAMPYIMGFIVLAGVGLIFLAGLYFIFWLFFRADLFPDE